MALSLKALVELDRERGLTYRELAVRTGVSAPSLCRYSESGAVPTAGNYAKLRSYFGERLREMETETDRRRLRARRNLVDMNAASNEVKRVHAAAGGRAGSGGRKPRRAEALQREWAEGRRKGPASSPAVTWEHRARVSMGKYLSAPTRRPRALRSTSGWGSWPSGSGVRRSRSRLRAARSSAAGNSSRSGLRRTSSAMT